jgi:hypothetical protein
VFSEAELECWDAQSLAELRDTVNGILDARTADELCIGCTVQFKTQTGRLIEGKVLRIYAKTCLVVDGSDSSGTKTWKVFKQCLYVVSGRMTPETAKAKTAESSFVEYRPATQGEVW